MSDNYLQDNSYLNHETNKLSREALEQKFNSSRDPVLKEKNAKSMVKLPEIRTE